MRSSPLHQYPDLATCLTGNVAERPAGACRLKPPSVAGGTNFFVRKALA
jgi:hypothetical protein